MTFGLFHARAATVALMWLFFSEACADRALSKTEDNQGTYNNCLVTNHVHKTSPVAVEKVKENLYLFEMLNI